ncbi:hypothetical protein ACHAXT_007395 [Thalassiosira profunda]
MKKIISAAISWLSFAVTSTAFRPAEVNRKAPMRSHSPNDHLLPVQQNGGAIFDDEREANDSRRSFLAAAAVAVACTVAKPSVGNAVYGADAKIELPDIVQGMDDRNKKQCMVESLGTRQCLVYLDPENQLYKGSDAKLLFERLGSSVTALQDVPTYIETKQWNKVQGVLTGPMGTLSATMNELTKDDTTGAKKLSSEVRNSLYAISGAADRKNPKEALSAYEKAVEKLDKFVLLVSSS